MIGDIILIALGMPIAWFFVAPPKWAVAIRDAAFAKWPVLTKIGRTDV